MGFKILPLQQGEIDRLLATNTPGEMTRLKVTAYNTRHLMIQAATASGEAVAETIHKYFAVERVAYLHLHNAAPGCFNAKVIRV